ncbi:MAG: AraC family transcriptional regulator [Bacteroidetes bacterium]|nr:AraC family transcriptional regulator [Bacteroidota bacterium]
MQDDKAAQNRQADELPVASWKELERLFDAMPDVVFFVKDAQARYVCVNQALLRRLGAVDRRAVIGRTAREVFGQPWGVRYSEQDEQVLRTGWPIQGQLELHRYPKGQEGWCLTYKFPLRDSAGRIVGLYGFSRDLPHPDPAEPVYSALADALAYLRAHPEAPIRISDWAQQAGLRRERFERLLKALFGLTPRQLLIQVRIERAVRMLRETDWPIAQIAFACGYGDQSAFTRQFRRVVGLSPRRFRQVWGS